MFFQPHENKKGAAQEAGRSKADAGLRARPENLPENLRALPFYSKRHSKILSDDRCQLKDRQIHCDHDGPNSQT